MIGFSVENNYPIPISDAVSLLHCIGFDAVSFNWKSGISLAPGVECANKLGMHVQYLHAPQGAYHSLWIQKDPEMLQLLLQALEDCRNWAIPLYVMHVCSDFVDITPDCSIGEQNFRRITDTAAQYGIAVAFENTAKPAYLKTLMELYQSDANVGYCWDSGHEQCYTPQVDHLQLYGHRLLATHLNDNMGMRCNGCPNKADDLHLIPHDGIADWDRQISRLKGAKKLDILNFELKRVSKPDVQTIRLYDDMTLCAYFEKVHTQARQIETQYFN